MAPTGGMSPSRGRDKSKHVYPTVNTLIHNHLEEMTFLGVLGDPVVENVAHDVRK